MTQSCLNHTNLVLGKEDMYHAKRAVYDPILPTNVIEQYSVRKNKVIKNITEKPQFLLEFLLKYFSNEGDTCLDMTMGSGSCGVACHTLNRNFIGIELEKKHFDESALNDEFVYQCVPAWDSVGHMSMIAEMEDVFDIMIDIEDILDWSTFGKGKEILKEKYEIDF